MGVGIDIVKIDRIDNEELFKKKILSPKEIEIYDTKHNKKEFLAGRFSAKEAFLKANDLGILDMDLRSIEVLYNEKGSPIIVHDNKTYSNVSISHEKEYAVSIVIL